MEQQITLSLDALITIRAACDTGLIQIPRADYDYIKLVTTKPIFETINQVPIPEGTVTRKI